MLVLEFIMFIYTVLHFTDLAMNASSEKIVVVLQTTYYVSNNVLATGWVHYDLFSGRNTYRLLVAF